MEFSNQRRIHRKERTLNWVLTWYLRFVKWRKNDNLRTQDKFSSRRELRMNALHQDICKCRRPGFSPRVGTILWRREWQPTPVFLPGESHRQRSLVGYNPWGHKESDMTERLTLHYYCYLMCKTYQNIISPHRIHRCVL